MCPPCWAAVDALRLADTDLFATLMVQLPVGKQGEVQTVEVPLAVVVSENEPQGLVPSEQEALQVIWAPFEVVPVKVII